MRQGGKGGELEPRTTRSSHVSTLINAWRDKQGDGYFCCPVNTNVPMAKEYRVNNGLGLILLAGATLGATKGSWNTYKRVISALANGRGPPLQVLDGARK